MVWAVGELEGTGTGPARNARRLRPRTGARGWCEKADSVRGAERTACRRLISLIFAGWLPHDNRFVGELPCSRVEGHSVAGCLIGAPRILPPLSVLLPTHCVFMVPPFWVDYCCGKACPIAQMKPVSSRAMAVQTFCFSLPLASSSR